MSSHRLLVATLLITAIPAPALAQTPPPPPPKHEVSAEAAFVGVTGNASTNTFGLGFDAIARPNPWVFRHRVAFVRNEAADVLTAKSFAYIFRVERVLNARVSLFGEYAYFTDQFAGVDNRNFVNGGVAATLVATARQKLTVDGGLGYLNEARITGADVSSATYSGGTNYTLKLSDTADLIDELKLVGTFDDGDDWRLAHVISVAAKITGNVSLKVANVVRYSNAPAPGFKTTDTVTSIALVAKFKSQ